MNFDPCYANPLNGQLAVSTRVLGLGGRRSLSTMWAAMTSTGVAIERPSTMFAAKKHLWRPKERPPQH